MINNSEKPSILIIGAGLGGLALAQGLSRAGFKVTVFERDESPTGRPQGYRISMSSMGQDALAALLPKEKLSDLANARVADVGDGFTIANEKMKKLLTTPQGSGSYVQFLRSELRKLLQDGFQIEWNKRLVSFAEKDGQVVAVFQDGSQAKGDFLVGCDGGASTIRELLPSVYGKDLGSVPEVVTSIRAGFVGQIDRTPAWEALFPLCGSGPVFFLGPNANSMLVSFSERADRTPTVYWGMSEEVTDPQSPTYQFEGKLEDRARLLDHCKNIISSGSWHESLKKLIFSTTPEMMEAPWLTRTTRFPKSNQYPMVPSGRVTLLGDSAHSMPPARALGGSNVLEDARQLSELLASAQMPIDWRTLTGQYESHMMSRARKAVEQSDNAARMHAYKNPLAILLRNTILRTIDFGLSLSKRFSSSR